MAEVRSEEEELFSGGDATPQTDVSKNEKINKEVNFSQGLGEVTVQVHRCYRCSKYLYHVTVPTVEGGYL